MQRSQQDLQSKSDVWQKSLHLPGFNKQNIDVRLIYFKD